MPYDANGNWIPEENPFEAFDAPPPSWNAPPMPEEQPVQPPTPPETAAQAPPPAPMPSIPQPLGMQPSRNQLNLNEGLGIKTFGPMADAATRAADAYKANVASYEENTGQGEPQQYGTPEFAGKDKGPLSPAEMAEKFMADRAERGETVMRRGKVESPAQRDARNASYDAYVERSRTDREQERQRLRSAGDVNRDRRELQDQRLGAQLSRTNALQGAGPGAMASSGGPMAQNVGGAILLGPGFGRPKYDSEYGGTRNTRRETFDPQLPDKLKAREADREVRRELGGRGLDVREKAIDNQAEQAGAKLGRLNRNDAERVRKQFDNAIAEYRRRTQAAQESGDKTDWDRGPPMTDSKGNIVPSPASPRSYRAFQNRILEMTKALVRAHDEGEYDFQVAPEVAEIIKNIKSATDAEQMTTPRL